MRIKILLSIFVITAMLFAACKKTSDTPTTTDTTPPVITLNGSANVTIVLNGTYTDAGATATDNVDGNVSVGSDESAANPKVSVAGVYTITYTASDKAGNVAHATRTVNVIADHTPPVITLNGSATVSVTQNTSYTDAGATATDNVDGTDAVTSDASGTNPNVAVIGAYTITYTSTDHAGNVAHATRTVNVIANTGGIMLSDYLAWNKTPSAYFAKDSDLTAPSNSFTFYGTAITGSGSAIQIGDFWSSTQSLQATISGGSITITGTQSFYPDQLSGNATGTMNSSKNMITLYIHNASDNSNHIVMLTKL